MMFVLNVLSRDFKIFQPFLPWWWASHFQLVTIDFLSIFHYGLKNFGWSKWLFPCQGACHWPVKTGTTKRINEGRRNMNKGGWNQVMAVWPQKIRPFRTMKLKSYIPPTTHWPSKSNRLVKKWPSDQLFFSGVFWQTFASTKCLFSFQRFTLTNITTPFSHALHALPTSRNKPPDLQHLCAAMWKNTPTLVPCWWWRANFFPGMLPSFPKHSRHLHDI